MAIEILCVNPECGAAISGVETPSGGSGRCSRCGWAYSTRGTDEIGPSSSQGMPSDGASGSPGSIEPGTVFDGRYRIEGLLGEGGMGVVYLAFDLKLQRRVALKIPNFQRDDHPDLVKRFEREARIAAGFDHPNLCQVYDFGQVGGVHYLSMPFIEGEPLSSLLKAGPLSPCQAAGIVHVLALALAEAHRRGVIHRDLKPSNIMISSKGQLIVMDFGIARLAGSSDSLRTGSGVLLGTPAYMSPEQVEGNVDAIGPWTDVYCLGVILYQLLTGQPPFTGHAHWVCVQVIHEEPQRPSSLRPALDPILEAVCLKAMAKRPGDRYASMEEMASALELAPGQAPPVTRPLGPPLLGLAPADPPSPSISTKLLPADPPSTGQDQDEPSSPHFVSSVPRGSRSRPLCGRGRLPALGASRWRNRSPRMRIAILLFLVLVAILVSLHRPGGPASPGSVVDRPVHSPPPDPTIARNEPMSAPVLDGDEEPGPLSGHSTVALAAQPDDPASQAPSKEEAGETAGGRTHQAEKRSKGVDVPARDAPEERAPSENRARELAEWRAELLGAYRSAERAGRDDDILKAWSKVHEIQSGLAEPVATVIIKVRKCKSNIPLKLLYHHPGGVVKSLKLNPGMVEMLAVEVPATLTYPLLASPPAGSPTFSGGGTPPPVAGPASLGINWPLPGAGAPYLVGGPPPMGGGPPHLGGGPPRSLDGPPPPTVGPLNSSGGPFYSRSNPPAVIEARPITSRRIDLKHREMIVEFSLVGGRWKPRSFSPSAVSPPGLVAAEAR